MATVTRIWEPRCGVQVDPSVERRVEILGSGSDFLVIASRADAGMGGAELFSDFAEYYATRAELFRRRPKLPQDSSEFYEELF